MRHTSHQVYHLICNEVLSFPVVFDVDEQKFIQLFPEKLNIDINFYSKVMFFLVYLHIQSAIICPTLSNSFITAAMFSFLQIKCFCQ